MSDDLSRRLQEHFSDQHVRVRYQRTVESQGQYRSIKRALGREIAALWRQAVSGTVLPGMTAPVKSQRYRDAIAVTSRANNRVIVEARDPIALSIARGHGPIDLKPGLLDGPNARMGPGGRYTIVGFHWSVGPKHGTIPVAFQHRVRRLQPGGFEHRVHATGRTGGPASAFVRRRQPDFQPTPAERALVRDRRQGIRGTGRLRPLVNWGRKTTATGYERQWGHLQGLTGSRRRGGSLMTFRTVSENSDPQSWILPAQAPNPIAEAVWREVLRRHEA